MTTFWKNKNVVVTGGNGFLGSHLCDLLRNHGCDPFVPNKEYYDLRSANEVKWVLDRAGKVDYLFNLAANVGGIGYNQNHSYSLFFDNIMIGVNVIDQSITKSSGDLTKVGKLIQVGTVCSYPKHTRAPFRTESFWDGYPEETNAPYGLAKKMLLIQLQAARQEFGFNGIYIIPTNLYGPRDEFDPERSHVIPALIRKCIEARQEKKEFVEAWGSGEATRDFLFVKDAARGILDAARRYNSSEPLNLGSGRETKIKVLLYQIMKLLDYEVSIKWDRNKPDGQPRRVLDTREARELLGWSAEIPLRDGLKETIYWYERARSSGKLYNERSLLEGEYA